MVRLSIALFSHKISTYRTANPVPNRVNKDGKFVYIKYHFLANNGQKQFTADEATRLSGEDPDYSKRDLWRAIENGEEITWTAHVQIMQPEEADPDNLGFDPFDVTKVWPKSKFPVSIFIYQCRHFA